MAAPEGKGFGWYYANAILETGRAVLGMESAETVPMPADSLYHQQKNQTRVLELERLVAELRRQLAMGPVVDFLGLKTDALDGVDLAARVQDRISPTAPGYPVLEQFMAEQGRYKTLAEERDALFTALEESEHMLKVEVAKHHQTANLLEEARLGQESVWELRDAFEECQTKLIREQKTSRAAQDKAAQLEHSCKKYTMHVAALQKELENVKSSYTADMAAAIEKEKAFAAAAAAAQETARKESATNATLQGDVARLKQQLAAAEAAAADAATQQARAVEATKTAGAAQAEQQVRLTKARQELDELQEAKSRLERSAQAAAVEGQKKESAAAQALAEKTSQLQAAQASMKGLEEAKAKLERDVQATTAEWKKEKEASGSTEGGLCSSGGEGSETGEGGEGGVGGREEGGGNASGEDVAAAGSAGVGEGARGGESEA
eukprot:TRINITY_DN728_c0_g1_i14.p1 TRINITY_DN728_c0_g1~~TRINITY_DN728_c0_g1_i14.p1  ORF type:complete len:436 (+),score=180.89 TRINITY_DN728_c0_g1_i14:57-1364(+)